MTKHEATIWDICGAEGDYAARVLRTKLLTEHAGKEVASLVRALVPHGFEISIERDKLVGDANRIVVGSETWPYVVTLRDARLRSDDPNEREAASDAHIFCAGRTLAGALGKLLAVILDGGGFFPLT